MDNYSSKTEQNQEPTTRATSAGAGGIRPATERHLVAGSSFDVSPGAGRGQNALPLVGGGGGAVGAFERRMALIHAEDRAGARVRAHARSVASLGQDRRPRKLASGRDRGGPGRRRSVVNLNPLNAKPRSENDDTIVLNGRNCGGQWWMRLCKCKPYSVYVGGCGRRSCPICGQHKSRSSTARVLARLLVGGSRFQFIVLTVPLEIRARFAAEGGSDEWRAALRAFVTWAKKNLGLKFGYVRTHPCGDRSDIFHPHANLIFVQRDGFRGKLPVDAIQAEWARILGYAGKVVIHVQFVNASKHLGKLVHHVRYIERAFPDWEWPASRLWCLLHKSH